MKKFIPFIASIVLISSSAIAQSGGYEAEYANIMGSWKAAREQTDKNYVGKLQALQKQVAGSKLGDNTALLAKINSELSSAGAANPALWYVGKWRIEVGAKELYVMVNPEGVLAIDNTTGKSRGNIKAIVPLEANKIQIPVGGSDKVIWTKMSPSGDRAKLEWFTSPEEPKGSIYSASKLRGGSD